MKIAKMIKIFRIIVKEVASELDNPQTPHVNKVYQEHPDIGLYGNSFPHVFLKSQYKL